MVERVAESRQTQFNSDYIVRFPLSDLLTSSSRDLRDTLVYNFNRGTDLQNTVKPLINDHLFYSFTDGFQL